VNRDLVQAAVVAGVAVFIAALVYEFVTAPAPRERSTSATREPPVARAAGLLSAESMGDEIDHRKLREIGEDLLEREDPAQALRELDDRLSEERQLALCATGYAAYYTGYLLMQRDRDEEAAACWGIGLESFERWRGAAERPALQNNDVMYHARTLMRLGRGEQAIAVLDGAEWPEPSAPGATDTLTTLGRTLASSGAVDRGATTITDAILSLYQAAPDGPTARAMSRLNNNVFNWHETGEPGASDAAAIAAGEVCRRVAELETAGREPAAWDPPSWFDVELRRAGIALGRLGFEEQSRETLGLGERLALARAERGGSAFDWRWVAKHRAALGDVSGMAEAIRAAAGTADADRLSADDFTLDPDLRGYMDLPHVRSAVREFGEPRAWAAGEGG